MKLGESIRGLACAKLLQNDSHLGVHLSLHPRPLAGSTTRVEHDLGVLAGVDYKADNPFGVPKHSSAQQCLSKVNREFLIRCGDGGRELIHVVIGSLAVYTEGVLGIRALFGVAEMGQGRASTSRLEVRLSVQVFGFHKGDVLFLGGCADDEVRGDRLVVVDFDEISYFDVFPSSLTPAGVILVTPPVEEVGVVRFSVSLGAVVGIIILEPIVIGLLRVQLIRSNCALLHFYIHRLGGLRLPPERARNEPPNESPALLPGDVMVDEVSTLQYPNDRRVDSAVRLMAFDVFITVLEGGDTQDDEQRQDHETGRYGGEDGEELKDSDCREESVWY